MDRFLTLLLDTQILTRSKLFTNRGAYHLAKYKQDGKMADLSEAIGNLQNALVICPPRHPHRHLTPGHLIFATLTRYDLQGDINDLNLGIQYQQEWLDLHPLRDPFHLHNVARTIMARHVRDENLADLTLTIQYHEEALALSRPGHPDRSSSLHALADALQNRYEKEGKSDDLTRAIQYYHEAVDLRPLGHPDRSISLHNLAISIDIRYRMEGHMDDLPRAIQYYHEALDLRPPGHPLRSSTLFNLAGASLTQYRREGDTANLTLAIQYHEEALDLRSPGHPDRSSSLSSLASMILLRYGTEGNLADLTCAMQYCHEALDLDPPGHPGRPMLLYRLANTMKIRYEREGNLDDLTRSIQHYHEALDLCPPGNRDRPTSLGSLAQAMWVRYKRERNLDDLTCAVQYHQEVLDLCPPGHSDRLSLLNNLAIVTEARYEREGNLADLALSIRHLEEALDLHRPGHSDRPASLTNLANAMKTRYDREGNLADFTRAIHYYEEALDLWPLGHPGRSTTLKNLAISIGVLYKREGNSNDLSCTIQYYREVLDSHPPGHPDRSGSLLDLAGALHDQYSETEIVGHSASSTSSEPLEHRDSLSTEAGRRDLLRHTIISLLREASLDINCSPKDRLNAALNWAKISEDIAPESTLEAYTSALDRLDLSLAVAQSLNQRHDRLLSDEIFVITKDLGVDGATWALQHGEPKCTVELLERGCSLLLTQIGKYHVDLDDLRLANPELADRFARLSQLLDASIVSNQKLEETSSTIKDPYERYCKASAEWTCTIEEIQKLRNLETFLKPTPYQALRKAAVEGPVIIVIPHKEGSAALIVHNDTAIHHIDLPLATSNRLTELSAGFARALNYEGYNDVQWDRECVEHLACLWNEVVGPIAQALQHTLGIPLRSRVWWCPISVACSLPLHDAGLYSKVKSGENFPQQYISLYTPTLHALLRAQRIGSTAPKRLLIISQPNTPGEPPLTHARDEADKIAEIVTSTGTEHPLPTTTLSSEAGTGEAV